MKHIRYLATLLAAVCLLALPNAIAPRTIASTTRTQSQQKEVTVWVNTSSGVYHCPGTRWYGKTKQGKYLSECEAQKEGYRPAYGHPCGSACGDKSVRPKATPQTSAPQGATALCRDGTYSFSQHRSGTCSHHGGVSKWLNPV
jgi:hypothetical protein